jgi:hypothetical protein
VASVQQRQAAGRSRPGPARMRPGLAGTPVMAALGSAFNVLALNLVLLVVSLPVVTLPMAIHAATTALDRWRGEGEERVVREFLITLRSSPPGRTTAAVGVPLAAIGVGVAEARYFLGRHYLHGYDLHGGALVSRAGLGLGLAALLITLTALGYVFLLAARHPALPAAEVWSLSARLAVRNLLVTGPLFLTEIAAAGAVMLIDPPLLILGVPVLLLQLMRLTARLGLRRAGLDAAGPPAAPGA